MGQRLDQLKINARSAGWPWPIEHPNDERAMLEGCYLDFAAAERVRQFFAQLLCVPNDEGGGVKPFVLMDWWYRDVLAPIFGWKKPDGRRRFDKAFITTAKKSGKSTVLSGLPLYMLLADGEEEAECYAAAVDRDQAKIVYRKALRMRNESPELRRVLKPVESQSRIVYHARGSWFEAISSDADSADGKNPHLLIVDELHRWKNREFFNALMYGDIARRQPLFLMITTAGDDRDSVGYEEYQFAKQLLDPDDEFYSQSHFAFIAEASGSRDWDDPEGWKEANPSLAEGLGSVEKLQAKCDEAKQTPRKQREFRRFVCNIWGDVVDDPWLPQDAWRDCMAAEIPEHDGQACYGGLDLAAVRDLTALCLAFLTDDWFDLRWWFWFPEERVKEAEDLWRQPVRDWVQQGWITATPGAATDYAYIRKTLTGVALDPEGKPLPPVKDCLKSQYDIKQVGFDQWNATKLVTELGEYDGLTMVQVSQQYGGMTFPCKELERLVATRRVRGGRNPVAAWMGRHVVVDADPNGNIKPNKKKSRQKIDGITAAAMAVGRLMLAKNSRRTYYENNPLEFG